MDKTLDLGRVAVEPVAGVAMHNPCSKSRKNKPTSLTLESSMDLVGKNCQERAQAKPALRPKPHTHRHRGCSRAWREYEPNDEKPAVLNELEEAWSSARFARLPKPVFHSKTPPTETETLESLNRSQAAAVRLRVRLESRRMDATGGL